jgi:hypothetical protein
MPKVSKALRKRRLKLLVKYLRNLPRTRKFNQAVWAEHKLDGHAPPSENFCGTSACVLGHAAMIPAFRRAGLKLRWDKNTTENVWSAMVCYGRSKDGDAGKRFFGLSCSESHDLFIDSWRSPRRRKIREIERLIKATDA